MESLSFFTILLQLFIGGVAFTGNPTTPPPADPAAIEVEVEKADQNTAELAACLSQKGAVMYGAYWCPHCQDQKDLFGQSFDLINYQECDAKGENGNPEVCTREDIKGYPTWKIPGQPALEGTQSLDKLAQIAQCQS
jgi:hypothetical protein